MSALSLFGLAKVSGTLVIDAQGKLTILPEGTEPRPGDVVINVLNDTEVGEDLDLDAAKKLVYKMDHKEWKEKYQKAATQEQLDAFNALK